MSRPLIVLAAAASIAVPIAVGVFALSKAGETDGLANQSLDAQMVEHAVQAESPPLALAPIPSTDLAAMAMDDPQGAVALVRQALLSNPLILDEAIAALEEARASAEEVAMVDVIRDNADLLFDSPHASVMGNPEGTITLVEFLDYNCHFCKRAHADLMRLIAENDDLRVVVKDFPVLGPGSLEAAQVASAFRVQGGDMTAFIDAMMNQEEAAADGALARSVALELGADEAALDSALEDPALMTAIGEAYTLAEQLDIRGTPAFILGEERIMGAVGFDALIDALRAERERLASL
jgi:protein-disulfide isomerase